MLLADTGPLVAVANDRDEHHERCQTLLETHRGPVAVPAPVIVEVCQLLASRRGTRSEAAFLTSLGAGELDIIDLEAADYTRAGAVVTQYADLPLGAVDACVIAVAERLRVTEIATLDRRHFTVARPAHIDAFTLLPILQPVNSILTVGPSGTSSQSIVGVREPRVGDKLEATDTETGKITAQAVTTLWVNRDTELMDVTVNTSGMIRRHGITCSRVPPTRRGWTSTGSRPGTSTVAAGGSPRPPRPS